MHALLSAVGRSFLRAFFAALITYSFGILAAPDLHQVYLVGVSALTGALAAGLAAIQAYVYLISFRHYIEEPYADWADSFVRSFIATFIVLITGWLNAPDLSTWRSAAVGAIVGGVNAGLRAIQSTLTQGEKPFFDKGLKRPPQLPPRPERV